MKRRNFQISRLLWAQRLQLRKYEQQSPPSAARQIRQALTRAGLRTAVESAVAAGSQDLKDWYEFSTAFERLNPQVIAMGEALSVSPASLDDLWTLGAQL